jgi:hypothetical protein
MSVTWMRNETKPVTKWGIPFRSTLEVNVAIALDDLGINWGYEMPLDEDIRYLPDFTIHTAHEDFQCPKWIEVKPAELIYAARDYFNVPERFDDDIRLPATLDDFKSINPDMELCKPKYLAELSEQSVLVVYQINKHRSLSIEMRPDCAIFSRSHPLVNWKRVVLDREKEIRRQEWQRQYRQEEIERANRQREEAAADQERAAQVARRFSALDHRPARFSGSCCVCRWRREAEYLRIAKHNGTWLACCSEHIL